ncbi:pyridoxal-phosphate dependent enzyme [Pinirhizobacter sp.]|jgi:threonine dehydratase|uniref:pyridoxal-phosphate dependent enzyme n=1 Tax=Pinirhizobacter sp. TaxID=2950432 RepID=UPI002F407237
MVTAPTFDHVRDAAARIAGHAVVTPVMRHDALDALAGAELFFKCENLQRGGAFKFRGACNAVWALDEVAAARGVVTHSSGNHGTALAMAAATRGIAAHVIVPEGAVRAKLALIEEAGAVVHRCAPTQAAREAMTAQVQEETGAVLVHPYADTQVMAGQGTATLELMAQAPGLHMIVIPVGGGGLAAGTTIAAQGLDASVVVHAAEPAGAADASRSLTSGRRDVDFVPDTICDGLRAAIGETNFTVLSGHGVKVTTVTDEECITAMRLVWTHMKMIVEVSSATVLAAVLKEPRLFAGKRIGLVLTGGNVDLDSLPW